MEEWEVKSPHGEECKSFGKVTDSQSLIRLRQVENEMAAREYEAVFVHFPNLSIVDIDRNIARAAAQLRTKYKIFPPDALQVAACVSFGAKAFLTNDRSLSKLQDVIDIIVMDDYLERSNEYGQS